MNLKLKHKKLYALLVACCLILSLAMLFTACGKDDGGDDQGDDQGNVPSYTEGPECGVYYYDVVNGEVILTLSGGNNFTLTGPDYNKAGKYTVDNNNIVLDFAKDEDQTANATLADGKLTLVYGGATMTLLKRTAYTVSFDTKGGSAVASQTVINGKTADKPADPTMEGYRFLGWYADSACTTLFNFDTKTVTDDVVVYANWAKVGTTPAYTVSFDLGYADAPALESIETVDGVAYGVTTPKRDGYTFGGWWISMYDDGAKLTYAYKDGKTTFTSDTTLYATWIPNNVNLAAPMASVTDKTISWTPVNGALSYKVEIKDENGIVIHSASETGATHTFDFGLENAGNYTVEVTSIGSGGAKSEVTVRCFINKALAKPSGLTVIDGLFVWNPVENADYYLVTVDCGNKEHNHTGFNNGKSTYFDFSNCSMQAGGIKLTVTAVSKGYANSVSKTYVFERNLDAIGNVEYNEATDSFVWSPVANALGYTVVVTVGDNTYTYDNGMNTSFSVAAYTGDISIKVTPVTQGFNSPEATLGKVTKTAPVAPTDLKLNGTLLTWSSDAAKFTVTVAGKSYTVEGKTKFDIAAKHTELKLDTLSSFTVSVTAIADGKVSSPATLEVNLKEMSSDLVYSDKTVYWPAVYEGTTFQIRVNGGTEYTVEGQNFAPVTLTQAGENVIEVICANFGTDWNTAVKIVVYAYEVKYMTRSEAGETVEYLAIGDTLTPPTGMEVDGYTFGGWYNTPGAAQGNGKEYSNTKFFGNGDVVLYANWTPNDYKVTFEVDETFVQNIKDGDTADVTYTKHFTLPVPTSTDLSRGYFVGWFTGPDGTGVRLTDELGNSVAPYGVKDGTVAYAFFAQALKYAEIMEGDTVIGYSVGKGLAINNKSITSLEIPAYYNGKPVLEIVEKAFHSCYNIVSITIPDTILYIGPGAFDVCNKLQSIEMVDSDPNKESNSPYSTFDGVLQYKDKTSNKTYLEFFPVAKYGSYTVSDDVQIIRPNAFKNSKISEIIISKSVETINANAFTDCYRLTKIEFAFGRSDSQTVTIEDGAFNNVPNVETLILPANLNTLPNIKVFDAFEALETIEVEQGGMFYSSKNNLLCDNYGKTLLYVPRSFRGVFEVPAGITAIGEKLMENNPYVTEVIIGEHVKSVGEYAFKGCSGLTKVVVLGPRDQELEICKSSFSTCTALKTVTFNGAPGGDADTVTGEPIRIAENAFYACTALVSVEIGENVSIFEIGSEAFAGNTNLEEIITHSKISIKIIHTRAFANCSSLRAFEIHKTTTSIGNGAFEDCSYLTTVSLGDGIGDLALGKDVFKNCRRLTTIALPSTLTSFDSSLFDGCDNIQNIIVDEDNPYLESHDGVLYTKGLTELIYYPKTKPIADGVLDFTVAGLENLKKIGPSVFKDNQQVKTVKIGANLEEIAKNAFENCKNLSSVIFTGTNATFTTGDFAFAGCSSLETIQLPASNTRIGSYAFANSALSTFTIPASTTHIGYNAFSYTDLTTITIPANVVWIGQGAFYNASQLAEVKFDTRTADLQLGQIDLSDKENVEVKIEGTSGVFRGTKLSSITLPKQVTYIGSHAFHDVATLTSVTIPADSTLEIIEQYAFYGTNISAANLNEGLLTIGAYSFANTKLTSINVPSTVTWIYAFAFSSASINEITFTEGSVNGEGLHINNGAFVGTAITSIHLPAQLKQIGEKDEDFAFDAVIRVFYGSAISGDKCEFADQDTLATITVSPNSTTYTAIDGVLYRLTTYDGKHVPRTLLFSPSRNLGNNGTVTVPATVSIVQNTAFLKTRLTNIIFEELDPEKHGNISVSLQLSMFDGQNYGCPPVFSNAVDEGNKTVSSLKLIQFPAHLTAILSYTLNGYNTDSTGVSNLVIKFNPESTVKISQNAMRGNRAIVTLELPKVSSIGQFAFDNNGGLTTLTFAPGSTVTSIGQRAFENCSNLSSFTLPASVKIIENMAFKGFGSQVKDKKVQFFFEENCQLETIGNEAFADSAISGFVMPDSVTSLGSEVFRGSKIETLTISKNLVIDASAGGGIVQGCTYLKEIIVPDGHQTLSSFDGVLYDKHQTSLYVYPAAKESTSYTIPDTVTYIAPGTFYQYKGTYLKLPKNLTGIDANAFSKSNLETIEIPAAVTGIGMNAFKDCKNLHTIIIPKDSQLTIIGVQAFYDTAITEIYLPDSVNEIGNQAFGSCDNLQSIVLPKDLKVLNSSTFTGCKALKSVVLNEGLETISDNAFKYCHSLTSIEIPNSVTMIGQYAFHDCKSLVSFICDDEASSLRSVGFSCFLNCVSLENVVFGPGVSVFGYNGQNKYDTFKGCSNLKEVVLPADLLEIPDGMFKNLDSLEKVTLPANLAQLGHEAFMGCPKLTTITIPASLKSAGSAAFAKSGLTEVVFAPGSKLTTISSNMFAECESLSKINLPATIVKIENGAFAKTALTEIDFPEELNSIGDQAFYGCDRLTAIIIPGNVLSIGASAFEGCSEAATLVLADGVKDIGSFAFADCVKIGAVSIPKSVKNIQDNPFTGCVGIKTFTLDPANESFNYVDGVLYDSIGYSLIYYAVTNEATKFIIPEGVFEIKGGAFSGSQLVEIVFGSNVKGIPMRAFSGSESLKTVVITNTITTIGDGAFMGCTSLESISIPASVTSIGEAAFANCKNLSTFTIETRKNDLKVASYLFFGCEKITTTYDFPGVTQYYPYMYAGTGITEVVIPDTIVDLNVEGVFANSAVASVQFPSKLKNFSTLGKNFFTGTKLTNVTLPSTIGTIGAGAFADCTELESFTALHLNAINEGAFDGCTALTTVNVNNGFSAGEGGLSVGNRGFANCTSLSIVGSNLFTYVYSYGVESFLNCTSLTGELNLSPQTNLIDNYAFSGCNGITKITISGRDYYLNPNTFSGLTSSTTVYFATVGSYDALIGRLGADTGWSTTTEAKFAYYTPSGSVEVTLTDDELKTLEQYAEKGIIAKEMMETVKSKWLEYKASFVTLNPSEELTKAEVAALDTFIEECKIKMDSGELQKLWIEYRKTLAKELTNHPKYFTPEELNAFNEIAPKMDDATKAAFMQKWFEYKINYSDANPSNELSKEEMEALKLFCAEIGLDEGMMGELQNRWPEYRKTLAAGLVTPVYIDLTDEEFKALEMFCKQWEIADAIEDLKTAWMQYKGALVISGKEDAKELSADEILLVKTMVETYGIEPKAATEIEEKLLKYKQDYASVILEKVSLNDEENKMVEEFIQNAGLDKTLIDSVKEDLVNYKKAFFLSGFVPGKELSQEESDAYLNFMNKYAVDEKTASKMIDQFAEYRFKLSGR